MSAGLSHVEIFGDDPEQLAGLYRELFGWRIEKAPGIDYWRIEGEAGAVGGVARGRRSSCRAGCPTSRCRPSPRRSR